MSKRESQKSSRGTENPDGSKPTFDPYWTNKAGKVASESEYVDAACREPKGFYRGARIR